MKIAPKFLGNDWDFSRFYITHRQYFTLIENDLAFVYRLGYQTTISGNVPFFYQSQVITSMLTGATIEGLGGCKYIKRSSEKQGYWVMAFFMGNVELRWKPLYFKFLKQDCYLGISGFYDFGRVTKNIKLPADLSDRFSSAFPTENILLITLIPEKKSYIRVQV